MTDLKVVIGERFYKWLQDHQATLFQQTWNSTSTVLQNSDLHILDGFDIAEWEWLIVPLTIAVRQAVGAMVRSICGEDINEDEVNELVLDIIDSRKAYYCIGVVWRTILKYFSKRSRIVKSIRAMFISRAQAEAEGLPTQEVDSK